jgi:trehalose synthase
VSSFREIEVPARSCGSFLTYIGPERVRRFRVVGEMLAASLTGRTVWNVTLDEAATGVAELVQSLLPYVGGLGIDTRWLVLCADADVRQTVWRLRQGLQGFSGDDGSLGSAEHRALDRATAPIAQELATRLRPGDLVLLHDPGPAPLAPAVLDAGATVIWRCHCGSETANESVTRAWEFLRAYVEDATAFVFSHRGFVPGWLREDRIAIIAPSIDPFSPKNRQLAPDAVIDVLTWTGLIAGHTDSPPRFVRRDDTQTVLEHRAQLVSDSGPPSPDVPLVTQITRWDPLKDMRGVLAGFAAHVAHPDAHLLLAGPDVHADMAGPLAGSVFADCVKTWQELPRPRRQRIHLAQLPADDPDESATVVNALQRHAAIIVHKYLAGDHSTAVAEAMLKARPIVASGIGGIHDQIRDHQTGLLVSDPTDLAGFAAAVDRLLADQPLADDLRFNACLDVVGRSLPDRDLLQWATLVSSLIPS